MALRLIAVVLLLAAGAHLVAGHGFLKSPISRNYAGEMPVPLNTMTSRCTCRLDMPPKGLTATAANNPLPLLCFSCIHTANLLGQHYCPHCGQGGGQYKVVSRVRKRNWS